MKRADLTKRIRSSDHSAYAELFEAMHQALLRYAKRLVRDDDAAYDVVQDVFMKLWDKRETLNPDLSVEAFLYTMVRNRAFNYLRDKAPVSESTDELNNLADGSQVLEQAAADDLSAKINTWIHELPSRRREAFMLSRFQSLSHREIGKVMGLSEKTVNQHILLALQHLRAKYATLKTEDQVN